MKSMGVSRDGGFFSGGDEAVVGGEKVVGFDLEFVVVDGGGGIAGEVPIGVVDDVDGSGLVGFGFDFEDKFVVVGEPVGDFYLEFTGVAFFAIFGGVGEFDSAGSVFFDFFAFPNDFVESL